MALPLTEPGPSQASQPGVLIRFARGLSCILPSGGLLGNPAVLCCFFIALSPSVSHSPGTIEHNDSKAGTGPGLLCKADSVVVGKQISRYSAQKHAVIERAHSCKIRCKACRERAVLREDMLRHGTEGHLCLGPRS